MTGFGAGSREAGPQRVTAEVRSVNHRFLKVVTKLPRALASLEADVEGLVRQTVRRGTVSLVVRSEGPVDVRAARFDRELARSYHLAAEDLRRSLDLDAAERGDPVPWLLGLPGVIRIEEDEDAASDELRAQVTGAVGDALAILVDAREAEGRNLKAALEARLAAAGDLVMRLAERAPAVPRVLRDRLLERVKVLLAEAEPPVPLSEPDLLREVCLLADRADVSEEIDRLQSHIGRAGRALAEGGEVGRSLDFLLQEMLREANTVGSKANDSVVAHLVIELKGEIERMKEQVQNVE